MKRIGLLLAVVAASPAAADPCLLNLVTHGTFRHVATPSGTCVQFVDDLGARYEVLQPRGSWKDGMAGTLYGNFQSAGTCSQETPIEICSFDADYSRNVVGTLVFLNFIECPGYAIRGNEDYKVLNCEDFGTELCDSANLGRRVKAEVLVDTGVSNCLGLLRSTVVDFELLK